MDRTIKPHVSGALPCDTFDRYLLALRKTRIEDKTEHTDRGALESLLQAIADRAEGKVSVQHEPHRVAGKGAPDFKVTKKGGLILGYVENKAIGENLDKVLKSEQIKKYRELSDNIVLTDYLHFIWIHGKEIEREILCHASDLESPKFRLKDDRIEAVAKLLAGFFSTAPEGIGRSQQLALALATRSRLLRDYLGEELVRQEREKKGEKLFGLYQIFRDQIFHELKLAEFADAFAQMLAYGLFLARLNSGAKEVTLHNAREYIPGSFRLIRELVDFLTELEKRDYRDIRWVVEEVLSIVNGLDLAAIHNDLSFRGRKAISRKVKAQDEEEHRLFERDPFIYFYEDYLKAYDKETRKGRGVYYTPPPIVNFIIRAVDDILKDTFDIHDGLADHSRVTVLDFACGTGTFLLEVFEKAFENVGGPDSGKAEPLVREHFLKNIYGFEYLIAPYTIAHLKLSQYLRDKGHSLKDEERLQVFLTNTLEPVEPQRNMLLPAVSAEVEAAQEVKNKKILVITGNPPYSGHSKNPSERMVTETVHERRTKKGVFALKEPKQVRKRVKTAIGELIEDYKMIDGKPLGEQNPKWLQDDYVKFIRFAQKKMENVDEGVVGIISNHSFLDNPTFRGMRRSLMKTFNQIYVFDLHGSTKPKELQPSGTDNENVFDIQKGVAVSLLIKSAERERSIRFAELWGTRLEKYAAAASADIRGVGWTESACFEPHFMFRPLDWTGWDVYGTGWPIADSLSPADEKHQIFSLDVLGFQTHRDHFAIAATADEIRKRVQEMTDNSLSDSEFAEKYKISSNRDWNLGKARTALRGDAERDAKIIQCAYRPFDDQFCFFGQEFMDYPRRELLDHVAGQKNLVLGVGRFGSAIADRPWELAIVSMLPVDANIFERGGVNLSPLYRLNQSSRLENLSPSFRAFLDDRYDHHYSPEEILGYIYAVLYAPSYRTRYAEFLRIDFPRIPFPEKAKDFDRLSKLGWALVEAHLLRSLPRKGLADFKGKGDRVVEKPRYADAENAVFINNDQSFRPVPREVWEFHIGGYQVLDKYLKSRKGRTLSLDEINHVGAVADSLAFTIDQMGKIDAAYLAVFPEKS